jgi:hypothetical protein
MILSHYFHLNLKNYIYKKNKKKTLYKLNMLNGLRGLCQVTREITVLYPGLVGPTVSCSAWVYPKRVAGHYGSTRRPVLPTQI